MFRRFCSLLFFLDYFLVSLYIFELRWRNLNRCSFLAVSDHRLLFALKNFGRSCNNFLLWNLRFTWCFHDRRSRLVKLFAFIVVIRCRGLFRLFIIAFDFRKLYLLLAASDSNFVSWFGSFDLLLLFAAAFDLSGWLWWDRFLVGWSHGWLVSFILAYWLISLRNTWVFLLLLHSHFTLYYPLLALAVYWFFCSRFCFCIKCWLSASVLLDVDVWQQLASFVCSSLFELFFFTTALILFVIVGFWQSIG